MIIVMKSAIMVWMALALLSSVSIASDPIVANFYVEKVPGTRGASLELLAAADANDLEGVRRALSAGADVNVWTPIGESPLRYAIRRSNPEMVRFLIRRGALVKQKPYGGSEAWLGSVDVGSSMSSEVTRVLVAAGADIDYRGYQGKTILHRAALRESLELVETLLALGADPAIRNKVGDTPLSSLQIGDVSLGIVRALVVAGSPIPATTTDPPKPGLMDEALLEGRVDIANLMLEEGWQDSAIAREIGVESLRSLLRGDAEEFDHTRKWKPVELNFAGSLLTTPIHLASMMEMLTAIDLLVEEGADLEAQDLFGRTALGVATYLGKSAAVGRLLGLGADPNGGARDPIHDAVTEGHVGLIHELVLAGADVETFVSDYRGTRLLHFACANGNVAVVKALLAQGADPNARDSRGGTALHWVRGKLEVWAALLDAGADPYLENDHGQTPMRGMSMWNNAEVTIARMEGKVGPPIDQEEAWQIFVRTLRDSGDEDLVGRLVEYGVDPNGRSGAAAEAFFSEPNGFRIWFPDEFAKSLVRHGADVRSTGPYAQLLGTVCRFDYDDRMGDLVELILSHGADPDLPNPYGQTPLDTALDYGNVKVARVLLRHGARAPAGLSQDQVGLLLAVFAGDDDRALGLLPHIDVNHTLTEGKSPLAWAVTNDRTRVVRGLLTAGAAIASDGDAIANMLAEACFNGSLEMVDVLLRAHRGEATSPETQDDLAASAVLSWAVYLESLALAQLALDYGADPNHANGDGVTPLNGARESNQLELVRVMEVALRGRGSDG